jgi:glycosyltransferase involved in cell wall biosynthesis
MALSYTAKTDDVFSVTRPEVSVVIPCLNESKTIRQVIERAQKALSENNYAGEIVIADNGSTDDSRQIALACGARVVPVPDPGYGSALTGGIRASNGRFVVMGDADDTYDFMEMSRLIEPLRLGNEFVIGTRLKGIIHENAMPALHRYLGTPVLTMLINHFFNTRISDCNCGLRAFSREAFERMELHSTGMEFASEMIIKAGLLKLKMAEVPVTLRVDRRGRLPHLRTWHDGWRHLRFILAYAADQILLLPGVLACLLGLAGFFVLGWGPITVNGFFMDFHFLFPFALCLMLGTQLILFTFLAAVYTGLAKYHLKSKRVGSFFTVEATMLLGLVVFLVGLVINVQILFTWLRTYGQGLFAVRQAIIALTAMAVGAQIFFNAFFIGVLKIPQRVNVR